MLPRSGGRSSLNSAGRRGRLAAGRRGSKSASNAGPLRRLRRGPARLLLQGFCLTTIFHPNVGPNGDICVSALKKDWAPTMGLWGGRRAGRGQGRRRASSACSLCKQTCTIHLKFHINLYTSDQSSAGRRRRRRTRRRRRRRRRRHRIRRRHHRCSGTACWSNRPRIPEQGCSGGTGGTSPHPPQPPRMLALALLRMLALARIRSRTPMGHRPLARR